MWVFRRVTRVIVSVLRWTLLNKSGLANFEVSLANLPIGNLGWSTKRGPVLFVFLGECVAVPFQPVD